jgi:hypothetical protein
MSAQESNRSKMPKFGDTTKKTIEAQKEARRRRDRANYAKNHPIVKRKRKDNETTLPGSLIGCDEHAECNSTKYSIT